jgi:hypothetical protein
LILVQSIQEQMKKISDRRMDEKLERSLMILNRLYKRWRHWEDVALMKGVRARLKESERRAGRQLMQEWWMEWKHEEEGGIFQRNHNGRDLCHRTAHKCYQRYLELYFEYEQYQKERQIK